MAYKHNTKCGPNAVDQYDDYYRWNDGTYSRSHYVEGTGSITGCNGTNGRNWSDDYTIRSGIVELCDKCFNTASVSSITLPSTLTTIGSNCFLNSKIERIDIPEGLKKLDISIFPLRSGHLKYPKT